MVSIGLVELKNIFVDFCLNGQINLFCCLGKDRKIFSGAVHAACDVWCPIICPIISGVREE